jgi:DNA-binding NarL/FixJ family response regulator
MSALALDARFELVGGAANREEALQLARRTVPDIAIVDLHLPRTPGDELCRELRRLLPSLTVVILSSYLTEETVRKAIRAGAAAYVTKAAGLRELRTVLDCLYESRDQPADRRREGVKGPKRRRDPGAYAAITSDFYVPYGLRAPAQLYAPYLAL